MTSASREAAPTVAAMLGEAAARLAASGIDQPRQEARLLLAASIEADAATILSYPDRLLVEAERRRFDALVARRAAHEPAARLIGRREFWSLDFALAPETLVPRPDSETLVEAALVNIHDRGAPLRILDLGTGTGCLLLALLSELPAATGIGVDIAPNAAQTAQRNAMALGLAGRAGFFVGSWAEAIAGRFDVILTNPPYVSSTAIAALAPEVACYEPRRALDGGPDGLDAYRVLAPEMARLLGNGGFVACELGVGQAGSVTAIMRQVGLAIAEIHRDLAGIDRGLILHQA